MIRKTSLNEFTIYIKCYTYRFQFNQLYVGDSGMTSIQFLNGIDIAVYGSVNDFSYSHNGSFLAICDSEGYIYIYEQENHKIKKKTSFKVDEGPILTLSWADPKFGNLLGIGTYGNHVFVYQEFLEGWKQIAHNFTHQASVNCVEWAPYGLKLFAGSSDGQISILECIQKNWKIQSFMTLTEAPITGISIEPLPFGESVDSIQNNKFYPRIAVAKKDMKILIYSPYCMEQFQWYKNEEKPQKYYNQGGFTLQQQISTPKETIKGLIWRQGWGSLSQAFKSAEVIYCTQEGCLKIAQFSENEKNSIRVIHEGETPLTHIKQSITGKLISVTSFYKQQHHTKLFESDGEEGWRMIQKILA